MTLRKSVANVCVVSLLAACRVERTPGADSASAVTAGDGARPAAPASRVSATPDAVPANFVRRADSVLTRRLALSMWDAVVAPEPPLEQCNQLDDGPPPAFVAARARVLNGGAPRLEIERASSGSSVAAIFKVEITSVASLERVGSDGATAEYDVAVRPRVDIAEMVVSQSHSTGKWSVCNPLRFASANAASPEQGWSFAQASDTLVTLVKWSPSRANRDTLMQLVRAAAHPVP